MKKNKIEEIVKEVLKEQRENFYNKLVGGFIFITGGLWSLFPIWYLYDLSKFINTSPTDYIFQIGGAFSMVILGLFVSVLGTLFWMGDMKTK